MKKRKKPTDAADLRRQAEELLDTRRSEDRGQMSTADIQKLIHEMQVHRIELELQNEELILSRAEVEAGLERYTDLYDFAPVGYFTLNRDGTIFQVNLTGACLIGVERAKLINRRFGLFVSEANRSDFNAFLGRVFESKVEEVCEVALLKDEAGPLWAHFEALAFGDRQTCRAVVMDITERKKAEKAIEEQIDELRHRHEITRDCETRILNLKREVNELLAQAGRPPRYESAGRTTGGAIGEQ